MAHGRLVALTAATVIVTSGGIGLDFASGRLLRTEQRCIVTDESADERLVDAGTSILAGSDGCLRCEIRVESREFVVLPDEMSMTRLQC
jgi:hypothetical protein